MTSSKQQQQQQQQRSVRLLVYWTLRALLELRNVSAAADVCLDSLPPSLLLPGNNLVTEALSRAQTSPPAAVFSEGAERSAAVRTRSAPRRSVTPAVIQTVFQLLFFYFANYFILVTQFPDEDH